MTFLLPEASKTEDILTQPSWYKPLKHPKKAVIVGAGSINVLEAVKIAHEQGVIIPLLVGAKKSIYHHAEECHYDIDESYCHFIDEGDEAQLAHECAQLAKDHQCDLAIKGSIHTNYYLKAFLSSKAGFRTSQIASHIFVMEGEPFQKPFIITDGAFNIAPTLEQLKSIAHNAIHLAHYLGNICPYVGVVSASEIIMDAMPSSQIAHDLATWITQSYPNQAKAFGPVAMDIILSSHSASIKNYHHEGAGQADIIIVPSIEVGNVFFKTLVYSHQMVASGIVSGLKIPLVLTSRSDSLTSRLNSILLACMT